MNELVNTYMEVPYPFLFNQLKHHLSFIQVFIKQYSLQKIETIKKQLKYDLLTIGENLIDLYYGDYQTVDICREISHKLYDMAFFKKETFDLWINTSAKQYKVLTIGDSSQGTLRIGKEECRYIHIHPGKRSPHTVRVRANTLKSAIAVSIAALIYNKRTLSLDFINENRTDWLNESPLKKIDHNNGLGALLKNYFF